MNLATPENLAVLDHLLTTTRSVRKRLDLTRPVEREVIEQCLEIAGQAPSGSNRQGWHFVVVTDAEKKLFIAERYRKAWYGYNATRNVKEGPNLSAEESQLLRVISSARYLADHLQDVPVLVIPCIEGRPEDAAPASQAGVYGSILPAAWSLMLALRARGLGSAWTTLHLQSEREIAEMLGIPDGISQAALLPVAYFKGDDFRPAKRKPMRDRTYWDSWQTE
jgi:nitroreductase